MPLIIIEGVDGSGKTTLIDELAHVAPDDTRVKHCGPLQTHPLVEYEWGLHDYVPGSGQTILCDRWHVGELIYGPLYRGQSQLTPAMRRHVELFLASRGALRLYMDTPYDVVAARIARRGEDFLQPHHLHLVMDFYAEYAATENWLRVLHDYDRKAVPGALLAEAANRELEVLHLGRFRTYVGPPKPHALLLGDRGQPRPDRPPYPSAFPPYVDSSGHHLLSALEQAKVLNTYGLANAREERVKELWVALGRPKLITLGAAAEDVVAAAGINDAVAGRFNHPQYVRRFAYKDLATYGREIREAIDGA